MTAPTLDLLPHVLPALDVVECVHCGEKAPLDVTGLCHDCELPFCDNHLTVDAGDVTGTVWRCEGCFERCDAYEPDDGHDVFNDELHHYDLDYR